MNSTKTNKFQQFILGFSQLREVGEKEWFDLRNLIYRDTQIQRLIRLKHIHITGLEHSDLEGEVLVVAVETLQNCRSLFQCPKCHATSCDVFKIRLADDIEHTLKRMQNIPRRYAQITYTEVDYEDEKENLYPTWKRKGYDLHSVETPFDILTAEEEDEEQIKKKEVRQAMIKKILSMIQSEKEKKAWKLFLKGMSLKEIADKLGYRNPQGVKMLLRRSAYKVKRLIKT
ncbi:sigma-70 family RNA polymerase sigma factor [Thermodesulfovibrio yellowstonii]|uniref:sigma-70 family RNA polymerase sigma factor n=1 Tax=Thermodesulfovibrio yellowstonii TaxID=28262 RepID=UPI000407C636|nr:sigma-70 family RNA polymerase sigma factor [Thermodesulfovibrio islandicus]